MLNSSSLPSSPPDAAVDTSPLLSTSLSDHLPRSRRILRRSPPLRSAARFFRRASERRMMLREPSVLVRENAAEELEERQIDWAFSKPVVLLDILWNLAFIATGVVVLGLSTKEKPSVPLRLWISGYMLQGVLHCVCVIVAYRRRSEAVSAMLEQNGVWEGGEDSNSSLVRDGEDSASSQLQEDDRVSITKNVESANTKLSFMWWAIGFYWVTSGDQSLTQDSPQLYWLCITFLAFDVVIVLICGVLACLVGIAVCCFLPCILALLSVVADQEGATKEEIDQLPKYKFCRVDESKNADGDGIRDSFKGIMMECDSDTPTEHVLSLEDAECCICLLAYEDGAELRELPCNHHFHCDCIDKWLHINATCPLCKLNVLRTENDHQEV